MRSRQIAILLALTAASAMGQSRPRDIAPILEERLETPDVVAFQVRQYLYQRISRLPTPQSAAQCTAEAERIRKHLLDDVVFHGWPKAWVEAPPKFEDLGTIESGKRADLVVVNGDPYEFETLPDRVEAVYKDGVRLVG